MNYKTTMILVVLAALIGGYFFFVERGHQTVQERQENAASEGTQAGTPLFTDKQLSTEAVTSVTVERDGKKVVMKREGTEWAEVEPVRFGLNKWSVEGVVNNAASLRYTRKLQPGKNDAPPLEKLGLSPAEAVVTLDTGNGNPGHFVVKVGRKSAGGIGYVMVGDDATVYVVNDTLQGTVLDQKPEAWRKKTLQAPSEGQANRVVLTRSGSAIELDKVESNWSLGAPNSGRADSKAVSGLLSAIGNMYVEKFIADAPADLSIYGLDKPTTTLAIDVPAIPAATSQPANTPPAKPTVMLLRLGAPADLNKDSYFATWNDGQGSDKVVFTVTKADSDKFNKNVDEMRDPRITTLAPNDIGEITIKPATSELIQLHRGPGGWVFAEPGPGFGADHDAVATLVESITNARAQSYFQEPGHGVVGNEAINNRFLVPSSAHSGTPLATITLTAIGKSEPDVLYVFPAEKNKEGKEQRLIFRNGERVGYVLLAENIPAATATAASLRDREIFKTDQSKITRVSVKQQDTILTFERTSGKPATTSPATAPAIQPGPWKLSGQTSFESQTLEALVNSLASLRATGWVKEQAAAQHWSPSIWIEFTTSDGQTKKLTLDPKLAEAETDGAPRFQVDRGFISLADAEFRDRNALPVAASAFKQVIVTRGGKSVAVRKDVDGRYVDGDGDAVNQAAAGGLFDTLANLRVDRYLTAFKPGATTLTLVVETQSGQKITLQGDADNEEALHMTGSLGEKWVRVSKDVMKKLEGDLAAKEIEKPKNAEDQLPEAE